MQLYVLKRKQQWADGGDIYREATVPEVVAWLREQGAIDGSNGLMKVMGTIEDMRAARKELGSPATLSEAITATGIEALFWLFDGGSIEVEGRCLMLVDAALGESS